MLLYYLYVQPTVVQFFASPCDNSGSNIINSNCNNDLKLLIKVIVKFSRSRIVQLQAADSSCWLFLSWTQVLLSYVVFPRFLFLFSSSSFSAVDEARAVTFVSFLERVWECTVHATRNINVLNVQK